MEKAIFEGRVRGMARLVGLSPASAEFAIQHYTEQFEERLDEERLRGCVQLAGHFDKHSRASVQPASQAVEHRQTPGRKIINELRLSRIRPWIDMIRKTLLGETKAPFTSRVAAIAWLRTMLRQSYDWSPDAATGHLSEDIRA